MKHIYKTTHKPLKLSANAWLMLFLALLTLRVSAQVSPPVAKTTRDHNKQVIGYITQWDAWKEVSGLVPKGGYNQLNLDYSQYTILNFSFFGVAKDGSLHSGDYRNKNIYQVGQVQEPNKLINDDIYSSWDMYILYGQLDVLYYVGTSGTAYDLGYRDVSGGWQNINTGETGVFPLSVPKTGGKKGLIALAHEKGVKAMASVGGWSMCKHYPEMAADPTKRAKFINDAKRLIAMGFDGIDLDWEYPNNPGMNIEHYGTQDYTNFAVFIEELRAAIGPDKLITSCFAATANQLTGFDWPRIQRTLNYANIMTYDINGGWSNKAGHNAPLYDYPQAEFQGASLNAITTALRGMGVDLSKVNLGAPFYGRGVVCSGNATLGGTTVKTQVTVQPDGPISTAADFTNWPADLWDATPPYSAILQKMGITHVQDTAKTLTANGWTKQWDDVAKVPYLTNGKYFLSYDDKRSIAEKAKYIKNNGLAGVIIWQVYQDMLNMTSSVQDLDGKLKYCPNTISPLVNTINATFADGSTPQNQAPTVSITSPANNANFTAPASITISATAADADGTVAKVEFFNGSTKLGEDTTAPYSYAWTNVAAGNYTLTAKATDDKGATTTSTAVTITSGTVSNQLPTVSITSPANNATFGNAPVTVSIAANAADTDGTISKVEFFNGSTLLGTDTSSPYSFSWTNVAAGTYAITAKATDNAGGTTTSTAVNITVTGTVVTPTDKVIVGYWHNWDLASAPYIKLRDVNSKFNVIQVAFAEAPTDNATLSFAPAVQTDAEFISDMGILKSQGRKVLISIGGQNGIVVLNDATAKNKFVTSLKAIVDKYGFDGVDIDLEGGTSLGMDANDKNPNAPTTPKIVNLIAAVKEVVTYYKGQGKDFWLTMAPETYYVQVGYGATYGAGNVGAYLPIINGLRNELTFIHPQYYNTGSVTALDGRAYNQATPDFSVSMSELLLQGFPVSGTSYTFAPLREDQVAIGLPAAPGAAGGGYMAPTDVTKALNYLVKGQSFGGTYTLRKPAGYPNVRGIMTWSVNWDKVNNGGFSNAAYDFFFGTTTPNNPPTVSVSASPTSATAPATITLSATAADSDGSISKVEFYNGSTLLSTDTSLPYTYSWTGVTAGTYTITAKAYDNSNASTTSTAVTVTVTTSGNQNPTVSISSPTNGTSYTAPAAITINATAADADGTIAKVEFYNGATLLGTDTSSPYSYAWTNVATGTYNLTAKAYDNNNASASSAVVSVTVNSTGGCTVAAWDPAKAYVSGDQASYQGNVYQAKWWTQGDIPSTNTGDGKPWTLIGPCGGGGNQSPTVSISSPANGTTYTAPASITINATAADADGTVSKVEFYNGATLLGTDTSSPYSYSWGSVAAGSYNITAKAYDNNNASTTSTAVSVTVNTAGNQSPTVSIISPSNGASFTAPASISINANAADADGTVSKVEFYNGSTLLGTDTSSPYSYSWASVAAGTYSITAKAYDNNNASTTSSAVSVTVSSGTGGYDCSTIETYQTYPKVYNQGDLVKYNGVVYQSQSNALYNVTPGTAEHWWKTMGSCNAGTQAMVAPASDIVINLYPNPATGASVTVDIAVVAGEKVTITLTSTQSMQQYVNKTFTASTTGTESFVVDINNAPAGTYVLQVTTDHGQSSKTLVRQ